MQSDSLMEKYGGVGDWLTVGSAPEVSSRGGNLCAASVLPRRAETGFKLLDQPAAAHTSLSVFTHADVCFCLFYLLLFFFNKLNIDLKA